jgi:hypothetical protein
MNPYVSNGGGMLIQAYQDVPGGYVMQPQYWPYADGAPTSFSRIQYNEDLADTFTNHVVWGSPWLFSSYAHSDSTFYFQQRGPDFLTSANPP